MKRLIWIAIVAIFAFVVSCETPDAGGSGQTPTEGTITLTSSETIYIGADGGNVIVTYSINKIDGATLAVNVVNEELITSVNSSVDGIITMKISQNTTPNIREGALSVSYGSSAFSVMVKQEGDSSAPESYKVVADTFIGMYYAERLVSGYGHYWVILSNGGIDASGNVVAGGEFFRFDLLGPLAEDLDNIRIPNGTYTFDVANEFNNFSILNISNSDYVYVDGDKTGWAKPFIDATLTVDGNKFILDALVEGAKYQVTYEDDYTVTYKPISDQLSTLTSDLTIDLSNCTGSCKCYGDNWCCGYCNWYIVFECNDGYNQGVYLVLELLTDDILDGTTGFAGRYTAGGVDAEDKTLPLFAPYSFVSGHRISNDGSQMMGSLYQRYIDGNGVEQAPLRGGSLEIIDNGDGTHTIKIDATDDAVPSHKINLDWSGVLK